MADVTATAHVFPSANDVRGSEAAGWGESIYEKNLAANWLANLFQVNFVISGFVLPASDPDLTMTIPTGKAYIAGYFLNVDAQAITFPQSVTSHIFLKVLRDGNQQVSSVAFEHNTSGTPPADSVKIGTAVTDTDNVTSTTDQRQLEPLEPRSPAPATPIAKRIYEDSIVKGWCLWNSSGTISDDLNVSSVTDNGPGDWTVNWATAFSTASYAVASIGLRYFQCPGDAFQHVGIHTKTTSSVRIFTSNGDPTAAVGENLIQIIAIGNN